MTENDSQIWKKPISRKFSNLMLLCQLRVLEQRTALVEPEDESPDAVMERPLQTTSALKKGQQTASDSVNYYAFGLTGSWIGA
jgi:hypothetical protein